MNDASQAHSNYDPGPKPTHNRYATKAEQRLAFKVALANGATPTEAARTVGVNRNTGAAWAKQIKAKIDVDASLRDTIASKTDVAATLTELVNSPDTPPPYKVNAATALSRLMGYDAPTRSQVEVRQVPASVSAWLDGMTVDAIDVTPGPPMLQSHTPHGAIASHPTALVPRDTERDSPETDRETR